VEEDQRCSNITSSYLLSIGEWVEDKCYILPSPLRRRVRGKINLAFSYRELGGRVILLPPTSAPREGGRKSNLTFS